MLCTTGLWPLAALGERVADLLQELHSRDGDDSVVDASSCLRRSVFMALITRNRTNATITKLITALMNRPILMVGAPASWACAKES
jgi:hypothetical protein